MGRKSAKVSIKETAAAPKVDRDDGEVRRMDATAMMILCIIHALLDAHTLLYTPHITCYTLCITYYVTNQEEWDDDDDDIEPSVLEETFYPSGEYFIV